MKHILFTDEMKKEYLKLDIPFKNWEEFFDKYGDGKRQGNGIDSRYLGYANDVTVFWFTEDEYPFAYVFPPSMDMNFNTGNFFYLRKPIINQ